MSTFARSHRLSSRAVLASIAVAVVVAPSAAAFAAKPTTSSGGCKRSCTDTTAPLIAISAPSAGASVSGTTTVSGSSSDNVGVASVAVSVDGGAWTTASGTIGWSYSLDTTKLSNASHTITARATDTSGNAATTSVSVTVSNTSTGSGSSGSSGTWTDIKLVNPSTGGALAALGRGRQAEWGAVSTVLYTVPSGAQYGAYFRDASSGASSFASLPLDSSAGWSNANYAMTTASDLWIESGDGPIYVRHYHFSGSPLPSSATLVSSQTFGDSDSRHGDVTGLASGAVVVAWHQQGDAGPQGQYVAYRSPSGNWQQIGPLQFMPTMASKQVVAQNPADGSIWLFSDPDAWGAIGAVHLTESGSGLSVDWTNGTFISSTNYGDYGADPENPDLAIATDPTTGTVLLAYEDNHRMTFPDGTIGSYVAIARITTAARLSFSSLNTYVERISPLGLAVRSGQLWVAYRPVNPSTYGYSELYISGFAGGSWAANDVGAVVDTSVRTGYGIGQSEFSASMSDGAMHLFVMS